MIRNTNWCMGTVFVGVTLNFFSHIKLMIPIYEILIQFTSSMFRHSLRSCPLRGWQIYLAYSGSCGGLTIRQLQNNRKELTFCYAKTFSVKSKSWPILICYNQIRVYFNTVGLIKLWVLLSCKHRRVQKLGDRLIELDFFHIGSWTDQIHAFPCFIIKVLGS